MDAFQRQKVVVFIFVNQRLQGYRRQERIRRLITTPTTTTTKNSVGDWSVKERKKTGHTRLRPFLTRNCRNFISKRQGLFSDNPLWNTVVVLLNNLVISLGSLRRVITNPLHPPPFLFFLHILYFVPNKNSTAMFFYAALLFGTFVAAAIVHWLVFLFVSKPSKIPNGPMVLPIVGNLWYFLFQKN